MNDATNLKEIIKWLPLTLSLLACFGCLGYLLRFHVRRWWRANIVNHNLAPHERWPEILHWQEADEFQYGDYHCYQLVSIDSDGYAVVERLHKREYAHLSRLVGYNASARTRRINRRLKESEEYMELIRQFNASYQELEERDRRRGVAA